ncbi:MAG: hypothetical protein V1870_00460 [Candidatus Aenigmatarchaeota archaeon]
MNIESHKKGLRESLTMIRRAIQDGIENNQRTIGFNCSAAIVDVLEIYLHSRNLIDPGTIIKHDFFNSRKQAEKRLTFDFPNKGKIIEMLVRLEEKRNILCYGKQQSGKMLEEHISLFNEIKKIFDEMGVDYE